MEQERGKTLIIWMYPQKIMMNGDDLCGFIAFIFDMSILKKSG